MKGASAGAGAAVAAVAVQASWSLLVPSWARTRTRARRLRWGAYLLAGGAAFVLGGARYFSALRRSAPAQAFLDGAGPAAIGAILGSAVLLAGALRPPLGQPWQFAVLA